MPAATANRGLPFDQSTPGPIRFRRDVARPAAQGPIPMDGQLYAEPRAVKRGDRAHRRSTTLGKTRKGEELESTDVNFQVLRRTCATLFGAKAKDPRDTQAQLRHADPSVTLRHYQKSIPASVRAAAVALESELIGESSQSIRTGSEQVRN